MERLWISNIAAEASDEELVALVEKYAPDLDCFKVQRVEGAGGRPGAMLWFTYKSLDPSSGSAGPGGADAVVALLESVRTLSRRIDGLHWKGRTLSSSTVIFDPTR